MAFTELFAGIAVAEIDSAREWYERLIGRPADMLPNDNEAAWQLAGHGWVYLVGDAQRAGHALLTLLVDDLDGQLAGLGEGGQRGDAAGLGADAENAIVIPRSRPRERVRSPCGE